MTMPNEKNQLRPEDPATDRQRAMLRLAVQKNWLDPQLFAGNYDKWKNLTAGEADKLLASIPPERLGVIEKELNDKRTSRTTGRDISRGVGRGIEDEIRQFGQTIDGGF